MRISDWSSDVCSSDLAAGAREDLAEVHRLHAHLGAVALGDLGEAPAAEVGPGRDQGQVVVDHLGHGRRDSFMTVAGVMAARVLVARVMVAQSGSRGSRYRSRPGVG